MKTRPLHKNLDTSYVSLSALLKYLRRKKFVGLVRFVTKGYEAEIFLTEENTLESRENDRIAGRISAGEDVLKNLLIRAGEPGGVIDVYQAVREPVVKKAIPGYEKPPEADVKPAEEDLKIADPPSPSEPEPLPENPAPATESESASDSDSLAEESATPEPEPEKTESLPQKAMSLKEKLGLPSLPFSFKRRFERKAAAREQEWNELLESSGEILRTIEDCLEREKLNFSWIFDKVRGEIFRDFPYLRPDSPTFAYQDGRISMEEEVDPNLFAASILETVGRILAKLEAHPRFAELHQTIIERLHRLLDRRQAQFDKFSMTKGLEQIVGLVSDDL
ncbi:MAG: hypothetical protein R2747_14485 [Pyrinomonadaceae bacterium]